MLKPASIHSLQKQPGDQRDRKPAPRTLPESVLSSPSAWARGLGQRLGSPRISLHQSRTEPHQSTRSRAIGWGWVAKRAGGGPGGDTAGPAQRDGWWRLRGDGGAFGCCRRASTSGMAARLGAAWPGLGSGGAVLGGRNAKEWTTRRAEVDTPEFKVPGTQAKGAGQASHLGSFMIFELHLNHVL